MVMHKKNAQLVTNDKMSKLYSHDKKSFGLGVLDDRNKIIGIITDGDLRRKLNLNFLIRRHIK